MVQSALARLHVDPGTQWLTTACEASLTHLRSSRSSPRDLANLAGALAALHALSRIAPSDLECDSSCASAFVIGGTESGGSSVSSSSCGEPVAPAATTAAVAASTVATAAS